MAEFSAAADLTVQVDQRSLSNARRQIENDLGDVSVGVAPTGGGGGAVGSRGPEPATVDLSRRQLGEQETLVELAQARNELLEDLRGQGGGGGAGSTLLQVQGARSLLGGAAGGAAAGAAGVGTAGLFGGILATGGLAGLGGRNVLQGLFPDAFGETGIAGTQFTEEGLAGDVQPVLQVPEGFPPELQIPADFPSINVDMPQGLADALGIDVNVDIGGEVQFSGLTEEFIEQPGRGPRFEQEAAEERRRIENKVRTQLDQFEQRLIREIGGDTTTRTGSGGGSSGGRFQR